MLFLAFTNYLLVKTEQQKGLQAKAKRSLRTRLMDRTDYQYRLALRKLSHYGGNNLFLKADAEYDQS